MWHPIRRHLGRRGLVLLCCGYLWLIGAWAVGIMPVPTSRPLAPHEFLPVEVRVGGWFFTGCVAVIFAWVRKGQLDRWGYAALAREWAEGHSLAGRAHRTDDRFVGVELFQVESFDPERGQPDGSDPVQLALGILRGHIDVDAADLNAAATAPLAPVRPATAQAVATIR